ncbi:MAG: decaprenyl-phosphate phosphoribosyltransferase [Clostridia bacterium]|nr:decaprenyl-phosphate phosphoribosyltransferase [Clostridia bacterium]
MNCYDFDKTIYKKDSSIKFFLFCLKRHPSLILNFIKSLFVSVFYIIGFIPTKRYKEIYFSFLTKIKDIDLEVKLFWEKEKRNINSWYIEKMKENDVICSASPEFLVKPLFDIINPKANVICTKTNINNNGKVEIVGENLKGNAKVKAIQDYFNSEDVKFDEVYTDSMSDFPILDLTENKFIVGKGGNAYRFGEQKPTMGVKIKYLIKQLRVKHYVKNGLIFLPLFFSKSLTDIKMLLMAFSGFVSFCLVASVIYIINDIVDVKKDRQHYKKRKRPIACYMVKRYEAVIMAISLFVISIGLSVLTFGINYIVLTVLIGYVVLNLAYSYYLKNLPIVDVFVLAMCYIIRILFGGLIIGVPVSKWLYLTVLCGALFMGYGKRRNELKNEGDKTRKVSKFYTYNFLDKNIYISLAMCLVFYSLWASGFKSGDLGLMNRLMLLATIPIVYFIMMKYSLNIESENNNGDPIDVLLKDKILIGAVVIFMGLILVSLYVPINMTGFLGV